MLFLAILIMYIAAVVFAVNESNNWNAQQVIKTALFVFPAITLVLTKLLYSTINTLLKTNYKNTYIDLAIDSLKREIYSE